MRRRGSALAACGGALGWGAIAARLTFGAVPDRLTLIFDGT